MLKYLIISGFMFLNTPKEPNPREDTPLQTTKSELEATIEKAKANGTTEIVDKGEGIRYKHTISEKTTIQGTEYKRLIISYIDFKNKTGQLTISMVDLGNSELKIIYDGVTGKLDGNPEMQVDKKNINYYEGLKLLLLRGSKTSDSKHMFKDDFKAIEEQNKAYFHEGIDKYLSCNTK